MHARKLSQDSCVLKVLRHLKSPCMFDSPSTLICISHHKHQCMIMCIFKLTKISFWKGIPSAEHGWMSHKQLCSCHHGSEEHSRRHRLVHRRERRFQFFCKYCVVFVLALVGVVITSRHSRGFRQWSPLNILLTIVVVMSEKVELTVSKGLLRILGTLVGGLFGRNCNACALLFCVEYLLLLAEISSDINLHACTCMCAFLDACYLDAPHSQRTQICMCRCTDVHSHAHTRMLPCNDTPNRGPTGTCAYVTLCHMHRHPCMHVPIPHTESTKLHEYRLAHTYMRTLAHMHACLACTQAPPAQDTW